MNKKLFFVIGSMQAGGAERVASRLCSHWADSREYDVSLLTGDTLNNDFYAVSEAVERKSLNFNYNLGNRFSNIIEQFRRFFLIRKALKEVNPDIVILSTAEISIRFLVNLLFSTKQIYVCEHNNYFAMQSGFKRFCRLILYRKATKLLLLTDRDINNYTSRGFPSANILVMPNPLGIETSEPVNITTSKTMLSVGRLSKQKAFDRVIKIFKHVDSNYKLKIIGEGPEHDSLQNLINQYNLTDRVELVGIVQDMSKVYRNASLLLMTSIYEGLPMVIGEANAFGLPVIAYNCPTGPAEMITNGENGFVIEDGDERSFVETIHRLTRDTELLDKLRQSSFQASKIYSVGSVASKWSLLLKNA